MRRRSDGMRGRLSAALLAAGLALQVLPSPSAAQVRMLTGAELADQRMGLELAEWIGAPADVRVEVIPSPSTVSSLSRLGAEPGVSLAVVQSDVYERFLAQAQAGRAGGPPRVVLPLPDKEIHFVARADAPFDFLHQIGSARINAGPPDSGTAVTVAAIHRLMFGKPLAPERATFLRHEEALVRLVTDESVDVVAIAAGQPAELLANVKPEARRYVKLLGLDPRHPASRAVLRAYPAATARAQSYPALLARDVPVLAVKMYLVTLDFREHAIETRLIRFGDALCRNFAGLQKKGHPKWREVAPTLAPLPHGWAYYPPTRDELRRCAGGAARTAAR